MNNFGNIKQIKTPELNSINFASSLDEVFANINYNFNQLANYDFIKGESGKSIDIQVEPFYKNGKETELSKKLKSCIERLGDTVTNIVDDDKNIITVWDNFTPETAGNIYMIYNAENDTDINEQKPLSSLQYIFLDGRFANKNVGNITNMSQYDNIMDLSCIVIYDASINNGEGGFKALTNSLATLYYDSVTGLCWKINGMETGIPAQGIPGKAGENPKIRIVKCKSLNTQGNFSSGEITEILDMGEGFVSIKKYDDADDLIDTAVLILTPNQDSTDNGSKFYFGTVRKENNILEAICDPNSSINDSIKTTEITNYFKNISLIKNDNTSASGLFIPISNENNGVQPVHLMSAASVTNTAGTNDIENIDAILTPVSDINSLSKINDATTDDNNILVNKYLYLKINTDSIIGNYINKEDNKSLKDILSKYNYTLKYKLVNVIKNTNGTDFDELRYDDNGIISGSRYFVNDLYRSLPYLVTDELNDTTNDSTSEQPELDDTTNGPTLEYPGQSPLDKDNTDHFNSMPITFKNRITSTNPLGIYRWELCNTLNVFDVEDIQSNVINTENTNNTLYSISEILQILPFTVIYTTTTIPSSSSEIMWFNGIEPICINEPGKVAEPKYLYGWSTPEGNKIFNFVKFVPVYDNDFTYKGDTALNVNYNINITGTNENHTRNVTVHGDINCENINIDNSVFVGDYLKLNSDGSVISNTSINENIYSDNITSTNITSEFAKVTCDSENYISVKAEAVSNQNNVINIDSNGINSINLNKRNGKSVIDSDLPLFTKDAQVIVSNQLLHDQLLYSGNDNINIYSGTLNINTNNNSELAKDFNMYNMAKNNAKKYEEKVCKGSSVINTGVNDVVSFIEDNYPNDHFDDPNNPFEYLLCYNVSLPSTTWKKSINVNNISSSFNDTNKIQSFRIKRTDENSNSEFANKIEIETNYCTFFIRIRGRRYGQKWPTISNDSYIKLHYYYKIEGIEDDEQISELALNDEHIYTFEDSNDAFIGYDNAGNSWYGQEDYTKEKLRCRGYIFKPQNLRLIYDENNKNEDYVRIFNAYNHGKTITIYVYPEANVTIESQGSINKNKVINRVEVSKIVTAIKSIDENNQISLGLPETIYTDNDINLMSNKKILNTQKRGDKNNCLAWKIVKDNVKDNYPGQLTYLCSIKDNTSVNTSVKSTTICEDGIVMRAGEYTFGLGYGNPVNHSNLENGYVTDENSHEFISGVYASSKPYLFYYTNNSTDSYYDNVGEPKSKDTSKIGYARRTHAIPLEDLFDVIQYLRETTGFNAWQEAKHKTESDVQPSNDEIDVVESDN